MECAFWNKIAISIIKIIILKGVQINKLIESFKTNCLNTKNNDISRYGNFVGNVYLKCEFLLIK